MLQATNVKLTHQVDSVIIDWDVIDDQLMVGVHYQHKVHPDNCADSVIDALLKESLDGYQRIQDLQASYSGKALAISPVSKDLVSASEAIKDAAKVVEP